VTQIVGIVLVRNEDLFLERAVANVSAFCDRIHIADNGSTDQTPQVIARLVARHPGRIETHRIVDQAESHGLIAGLAGTATWVFAVDGDEIYDPTGLAWLRPRLLAGAFDGVWMVLGNCLHCTGLDAPAKATGHLSPPSRSVTKLHNFAAIESWDGDVVERLHGGNVRFRNGYESGPKRNLQEELDWKTSPFRCLHLCFLRRSSADTADPAVRENIMETHRGGWRLEVRRLANKLLGCPTDSRWKNEFYKRGPEVTVDARSFFPNDIS